MTAPGSPSASDVLMSDGRTAIIRPPVQTDRAGLMALHDQMDEGTLRLRFFNVSRTPGRHYVDHILAASATHVVSLLAIVDNEVVGLGTAERITPESAELAFVVADGERGHGLGTLLLEHLARACAAAGTRQFTADVLPENVRMAQVFRDAGLAITHHFESGVLRYELSTEASTSAVSATEKRHALAEERAAASQPSAGR